MIGESTDFSNWCYVYDGWFIFCMTPTYQPTKVWIILLESFPLLHKTSQGSNQKTLGFWENVELFRSPSITKQLIIINFWPLILNLQTSQILIQVARRKFPGLSISSAKASTNLAIIRWQLWVWQSITCWFERVNVSVRHIHIRIYSTCRYNLLHKVHINIHYYASLWVLASIPFPNNWNWSSLHLAPIIV